MDNKPTPTPTPIRIPYTRAGTFEYTWQEAKRRLANK